VTQTTRQEDSTNPSFGQVQKSRDDLTIVTDCETYITGFKLDAKIMIDVLTRGEVSKI